MANVRVPGTAGLILCGGRSSRMGRDKAGLRFLGGTLLERVAARMRAVAHPVAVAVSPEDGAAGSSRALPAGVMRVPDRSAFEGPLVGLAEGFRALRAHAERVLVMPVDMPFFTEPWLTRLADELAEAQAVLYRCEGIANALTAAYRLSLLPKLERLIAAGQRRPIALSSGEQTRILDVEALWRADQGPPPLMDVDTPEAYRDALRWDGIGSAGGVAIHALWRLRSGEEGDVPLAAPLWARTALEARSMAALLYPAWRPGQASPSRETLARVIRAEEEISLSWDMALMQGDSVVLEWT